MSYTTIDCTGFYRAETALEMNCWEINPVQTSMEKFMQIDEEKVVLLQSDLLCLTFLKLQTTWS